MDSYQILVNDQEIKVHSKDANALDMIKINDKKYHLIKDNQNYQVEIVKSDFNAKTITLAINGNTHTIEITDAYDQMVKEMGLTIGASQKVNDIKAPMPGLILDILVEEGQAIKEGDQLLILSAMKMENIITAPNEGVVKTIEVKKDAAVEKGQLLIAID